MTTLTPVDQDPSIASPGSTATPEDTVSSYLAAMGEQARKFKALADGGKLSGLAQMTLLMQEASMVAEDFWLYPERSFAGGSAGWGNSEAASVTPVLSSRVISETCVDVEVTLTAGSGEITARDIYRLQKKNDRWWIEGQVVRRAEADARGTSDA